MSAPKSNVDLFGSYLSRVDSKSLKSAPGDADAGAEMAVLKTLGKEDQPLSVKVLMSRLDVPPSRLMHTLETLGEVKLVEMHRTDNDETVALTDLGRSLAE